MGLIEKMAKKIDKGYFIDQLRHTWEPHLTKDSDIGKETDMAWDRMKNSPMAGAFKSMKLEKEDVKAVITEIVAKKAGG